MFLSNSVVRSRLLSDVARLVVTLSFGYSININEFNEGNKKIVAKEASWLKERSVEAECPKCKCRGHSLNEFCCHSWSKL